MSSRGPKPRSAPDPPAFAASAAFAAAALQHKTDISQFNTDISQYSTDSAQYSTDISQDKHCTCIAYLTGGACAHYSGAAVKTPSDLVKSLKDQRNPLKATLNAPYTQLKGGDWHAGVKWHSVIPVHVWKAGAVGCDV